MNKEMKAEATWNRVERLTEVTINYGINHNSIGCIIMGIIIKIAYIIPIAILTFIVYPLESIYVYFKYNKRIMYIKWINMYAVDRAMIMYYDYARKNKWFRPAFLEICSLVELAEFVEK